MTGGSKLAFDRGRYRRVRSRRVNHEGEIIEHSLGFHVDNTTYVRCAHRMRCMVPMNICRNASCHDQVAYFTTGLGVRSYMSCTMHSMRTFIKMRLGILATSRRHR